MEHKLILGGEQFLPFARSRIKALRATGLRYASQQFEVDGVSIKVRIAGEHEYIELSKTDEGQYLILPADVTYPNGVTSVEGATVPAEGLLQVKQAKARVKPHTNRTAGPIDWKDWAAGDKLQILTYDHGMATRYRVDHSSSPTQSIGGAAASLWMGGSAIPTGGRRVIGAGIVTFIVNGVTAKRLVYITPDSGAQVTCYASPLGGSDWRAIGSVTAGVAADIVSGQVSFSPTFDDPWAFSPSGRNAISFLSNSGTRLKRMVRCALTASEAGGVVTLTAAFTIGEQVGSDVDSGYGVVPPPATVEWISAGERVAGEAGDIYTMKYEVRRTFGNDLVFAEGKSARTKEYLIGADYSQDGQELLVTTYEDQGTFSRRSVTFSSYDNFRSSPTWTDEVGSTYANNFAFYWSQPEYRISDGVSVPDNSSRETMRYGTTGEVSIRVNGAVMYQMDHEVLMGYEADGYTGVGGTLTNAIYLDTAPGVSKRLVIHDIDARNQSFVAEEVTQTLTEDRTYSTTLTSSSSPRRVTIGIASRLIALVEGQEVLAVNNITVPNRVELLNWSDMVQRLVSKLAVMNTSGLDPELLWGVGQLIAPGSSATQAGNTASRKQAQFVTSMDGDRSWLGQTLTTISVTHTKTSLTAVRIADDGEVLDAVELAKIPLFSATPSNRFRFNPVKVI